MPFQFAFRRKPFATALIVGGFLALSAPAAHAQFFNFFFHSDGLDAGDVQNMLEDRGLALVAPLRRNGSVYIADVEGPRGGRLRLIVDAESGRIVQRFRVASPRYYGDYSGPRPPADVGESQSNSVASAPGAPPAVITFGQSFARGDDATSSPNVLSVPSEEGAKLRPKPQVRAHKRIELTPVPQPSQNASSPAPEAKPPVHAEVVSPATAASKAVAPTPAPSPAAAPSSAPAAPGASNKANKPAVNDVPVTPLD
jgi:hypothetical protein